MGKPRRRTRQRSMWVVGRPSFPPSRYFRWPLLDYFEGLDSERVIAWRLADSRGLRPFLNVGLHDSPRDDSRVSGNERRISIETRHAVLTWPPQPRADVGLVRRNAVAIDVTTPEAIMALPSVVRRGHSGCYDTILRGLAAAFRVWTPTSPDLTRLDRRPPQDRSNDTCSHPHELHATITKMKRRRAHAEHPGDLDADAVVTDTSHHNTQTLLASTHPPLAGYFSHAARGRRCWQATTATVFANCRPLGHICGLNLGLLTRHLTSVGTPRNLLDRPPAPICAPLPSHGSTEPSWITLNPQAHEPLPPTLTRSNPATRSGRFPTPLTATSLHPSPAPPDPGTAGQRFRPAGENS